MAEGTSMDSSHGEKVDIPSTFEIFLWTSFHGFFSDVFGWGAANFLLSDDQAGHGPRKVPATFGSRSDRGRSVVRQDLVS